MMSQIMQLLKHGVSMNESQPLNQGGRSLKMHFDDAYAEPTLITKQPGGADKELV